MRDTTSDDPRAPAAGHPRGETMPDTRRDLPDTPEIMPHAPDTEAGP